MTTVPSPQAIPLHSTTRRRRAGFTLIELMFAMTAGAIAISSMFFISSASTHYFRVQQRLSNMQSSLRLAMDQIRRDVSRAGFGATPSQAFYPACNPGVGLIDPVNFNAIRVLEAASPAVVDPTGGHMINGLAIHADVLRLFGNYSTPSEYAINGVVGATVTLQPQWMNFTRDFSDWANAVPSTLTVDANAFDAAFFPNRLVRLRSTNGSRFFATVNGTNPGATPPTVTVGPVINAGTCAPLTNGLINPVSIMQYQVENATGATVHQNAAAAGVNTQLVRRELNPVNPAAGVPLPNTVDRIVAERVIHFNVDLLVNTSAARNVTPVIAPVLAANNNAFPERIFSAIVTLAVRAPTTDPRFPWITQPAGTELTRYRFRDGDPAAARIRTARAEIFLPNVAHEWSN
jgi:prepilin-type N-terminal cleavage/methylation domain-containing protein